MDKYDLLVKLIILGDSGVGKTCLLLRYCDDLFHESYISTIGVDFRIKTINMNGKVVKVQIWDTAGQERFRSIVSSYYKGANAVMYVYDVTDMNSYLNIEQWYEEVSKHVKHTNTTSMLVGNKIDIKKRVIEFAEAQEYATSRNMLYIETSAKTDTSINDAFTDMIENYLKLDSLKTFDRAPIGDGIALNPLNKKNKCC